MEEASIRDANKRHSLGELCLPSKAYRRPRPPPSEFERESLLRESLPRDEEDPELEELLEPEDLPDPELDTLDEPELDEPALDEPLERGV